MTFDPWDTEQGSAAHVMVGSRSFSKTLVDRASKRIDNVTRTSAKSFVVMGDKKLGDSYDEYEVSWDGDSYACSCWSLSHGDSRSRRSCSHVVAVMLYRQAAYEGTIIRYPQSIANGGESNQPRQEATSSKDTTARDDLTRTSSVASASELTVISSSNVPAVSDPSFYEWDKLPLPAKFQEIHPHQWDAVCEAVEHFRRGVEVVFVDAPTGSGKSFIAELIRRQMQMLAFYVCHSKTLQDQFATDFTYAKVLKGRSNYPTLDGGSDVTCADCTSSSWDEPCLWCDEKVYCPYQLAKADAMRSKLAVLNTSYFMVESNYVGQVNEQREFGIIDECDTLESELMGFVEFYLSDRMLSKVGLRAPKEGSHRTTLAKWLMDEFRPKPHEYGKTLRGDELRVIRERMQVQRMMADLLRMSQQIEHDEGLTHWVRDNKAGPVVLKPVVVNDFGDRYVWSHAKRWLCMSATIISADELSQSNGLNGGDGEGSDGRRWEVVTVPMTFPVENRRIVVVPVADMSRKGREAGEWEHAATAIHKLIERHPNERVLVHTVSYDLARLLMDRLSHSSSRPLITYKGSSERDTALSRFRRVENAVLVAPSMDRGVDLAGDDCRVVIVAKVPFPNLGDPQVNARMHMKDGEAWYAVQTVRKLVQMTGRAVRSKDDWCVTYIVDQQFGKKVWKMNRGLLPKWWREAVDMTFNVRELMRG